MAQIPGNETDLDTAFSLGVNGRARAGELARGDIQPSQLTLEVSVIQSLVRQAEERGSRFLGQVLGHLLAVQLGEFFLKLRSPGGELVGGRVDRRQELGLFNPKSGRRP